MQKLSLLSRPIASFSCSRRVSCGAGVIFESNAIARYVARLRRDTELTGRSFFETAQVDSWVDFCSHEIELPATLWIYPVLGWREFKQTLHDKAVPDLFRALSTLERHLISRTYIVGEAVTLAVRRR